MRGNSAMGAHSGGRRDRRKASTQRELLHAGRKLFSERGLYESRVEDLTRFAGVAKGTLYQYFHSKDELIQAVVAMGFAELASRIRQEASESRSVAGQAERIALAHYEFFTENPDLMRVFHQVRGLLKFDHRRWRVLRTTLLEHLKLIADMMAAAPSAAPLSRAQCSELAVRIFGAVSGIASVQASVRAGGRLPLRPGNLPGAIAAMAVAGTARVGARARYSASVITTTSGRGAWPRQAARGRRPPARGA
jgi:AcrR family transcriptional regulator